ncbi:MAG: hypothetical protein PF795_04730, partial [Kiritimatiellae bacterium]|nr:hypothetical protein [Kiritimatiellia bacterium]
HYGVIGAVFFVPFCGKISSLHFSLKSTFWGKWSQSARQVNFFPSQPTSNAGDGFGAERNKHCLARFIGTGDSREEYSIKTFRIHPFPRLQRPSLGPLGSLLHRIQTIFQSATLQQGNSGDVLQHHHVSRHNNRQPWVSHRLHYQDISSQVFA